MDHLNELLDAFNVGDVVALNSGGPLMTVSAVVKRGPPSLLPGYCDYVGVHCRWVAEDGRLQSFVFMPQMLRLRKE